MKKKPPWRGCTSWVISSLTAVVCLNPVGWCDVSVYGSGGRSSLCGFRSANLVCGVCGDGDGGHGGASATLLLLLDMYIKH